jgi:hypothetical protein
MKTFLLAGVILFLLAATEVFAQDTVAVKTAPKWVGSADLNFYFFKDDFITLPVIRGDKGKLHLEARYNYEDEKSVSFWGGYNFSGGEALEYFITPMAGIVAGETAGIAPGLEMTFGFHSFELYSESEYMIDPSENENNFFYNWTDLTWSPADWLWFGISGQRTRLYQSEVDIQRGILLGGGYKSWEFSGYIYNPASDDQFFIATVSWSF